jgi:hypothetical protein
MNKWFVVHSLLSFSQHSDMIGNAFKDQGTRQPKSASFACIKKGDNIVYYASRASVITGVFRVSSGSEILADDLYWRNMIIFRIKPYKTPPKGYFLNFRKLVLDKNVKFDLFPKKAVWGSYLIGKSFLALGESDYQAIINALDNSKYLRPAPNRN